MLIRPKTDRFCRFRDPRSVSSRACSVPDEGTLVSGFARISNSRVEPHDEGPCAAWRTTTLRHARHHPSPSPSPSRFRQKWLSTIGCGAAASRHPSWKRQTKWERTRTTVLHPPAYHRRRYCNLAAVPTTTRTYHNHLHHLGHHGSRMPRGQDRYRQVAESEKGGGHGRA